MRDVIAVDVVDAKFHRNQLFDPSVAARYPGTSAMTVFLKLGTTAGFQVITADMVDELGIDACRVMVVASDRMKWSQALSSTWRFVDSADLF